MRPDQHKQKKHAQYKRKHNIPQKDTNDEKNEDKKSNTASCGKPKPKGNYQSDVLKGKSDFKQETDRELPSDSCDDVKLGTLPVYENKTFRRREIVSNWNRYTLPELDEKQTKGEDFKILLDAAAVGVQGQFRFKDEQAWESDVPCLSDLSHTGLNCEVLAAAIQCIPLHDQLRLDEKLFTKDQLKMFIEEAGNFHEIYKSLPKSSNDTPGNISSSKLKSSEEETTSALTSKSLLRTPLSKGESIVLTDSLMNKTGVKEVTSIVNTDKKKDFKFVGGNKNKMHVSDAEHKTSENIDDVLDFLLNMDTPQKHKSDVADEVTAGPEKEKEKVLENKTEEAELKQTPPEESKPSAKADKEEFYDDWLDSILEDSGDQWT